MADNLPQFGFDPLPEQMRAARWGVAQVTSNQHVAQTFARHHVCIFPCRDVDSARGKAKAPHTRNGYHDASTVNRQLKTWDALYPTALYGLPCASNEVFILDADRHGNGDGVESLFALFTHYGFNLSSYPCVRTPRDGLHVIFKRPAHLGKTKGRLAEAIDVRDNGYVIAPGTALPDGRQYQLLGGTIEQLAEAIGKRALPLLPGWLAALVVQPPFQARTQVQMHTNPDIVKRQICGLVRAVVRAPEGNRNRVLFWASCRVGALVSQSVIGEGAALALLIEAGRQAGLSNYEATATAKSGLRRVEVEANDGS